MKENEHVFKIEHGGGYCNRTRDPVNDPECPGVLEMIETIVVVFFFKS